MDKNIIFFADTAIFDFFALPLTQRHFRFPQTPGQTYSVAFSLIIEAGNDMQY